MDPKAREAMRDDGIAVDPVTYRIHLWSAERGKIFRRYDYKTRSGAIRGAITHSIADNVREVSITHGTPDQLERIGVARKGEWHDSDV